MGLLVVLDRWLLSRLIRESVGTEQINALTFLMGLVVLLSLPLMAFLIYQIVGCLTLRYHLDRNGLFVRWAGAEQRIPIRDIQRILPGQALGKEIIHRRGVRWPGHERGQGLVPGIGLTRFFATRPLPEQLLLVTPGEAFGISPQDTGAFLEAYGARSELGPNRLVDREERRARWLTWPVWTDRTAWLLLGTALVVNIGLFGYLSLRFPRLDLQLPLHFNSQGLADRIGTRMDLFALPIIGLIILGTNALLGLVLYRQERAGSYLLWGAAAASQALFWLAVFSIGL
jgi:hypothetical protein